MSQIIDVKSNQIKSVSEHPNISISVMIHIILI